MATEVVNQTDLPIEAQCEPVSLSQDSVRRETGEKIGIMSESVRALHVYPRFREWLSDETRPGQFYIGYHRGDRLTLHGRRDPELRVYISDPAVRFEFKLRWA